jgi:ketosteroid isomerase-like protein
MSKLTRKMAAMRLASVVLVCVFAFSVDLVCAGESKDRESDRRAIQGVLVAQQEAWNRGDVDAFMAGYWRSPELSFSGSSGISRGWDEVLARYKKNYPDRAAMGQLDFSNLEFRFLGVNHALVLGRWHLKREKGEIGGVFSLVWERFPEGWRIIHDHTSANEAAK